MERPKSSEFDVFDSLVQGFVRRPTLNSDMPIYQFRYDFGSYGNISQTFRKMVLSVG